MTDKKHTDKIIINEIESGKERESNWEAKIPKVNCYQWLHTYQKAKTCIAQTNNWASNVLHLL